MRSSMKRSQARRAPRSTPPEPRGASALTVASGRIASRSSAASASASASGAPAYVQRVSV